MSEHYFFKEDKPVGSRTESGSCTRRLIMMCALVKHKNRSLRHKLIILLYIKKSVQVLAHPNGENRIM